MKSKQLHLNIASPEKTLFEGEVTRVALPGLAGAFTILPHHAPIVSTLGAGKIVYATLDGKEESIDALTGFAEMSANAVTVCLTPDAHGNK